MLNSVVKISMMSGKYFKYYTIILRGAAFSWTHCIYTVPNYCASLQTLNLCALDPCHFFIMFL